MKHCEPCGRPRPPVPLPPECGGSFLMQRILAQGRLCLRPCELELCNLPGAVRGPFTVLEAGVCGQVQWQEIPCHRRGGVALLVNVPVALRLQDACCRVFSADAAAEKELFLQYRCRENEGWRGQIFVEAAARPWRGCGCGRPAADCGRVPVELLVEGYLLSPCAVGCPDRLPCPEPRPLYPPFDPWGC